MINKFQTTEREEKQFLQVIYRWNNHFGGSNLTAGQYFRFVLTKMWCPWLHCLLFQFVFSRIFASKRLNFIIFMLLYVYYLDCISKYSVQYHLFITWVNDLFFSVLSNCTSVSKLWIHYLCKYYIQWYLMWNFLCEYNNILFFSIFKLTILYSLIKYPICYE